MDRSDSLPFYLILPAASDATRPLQQAETRGLVLERERLAILELVKRHPSWGPTDIRRELMRSEREMVRQLGGELLLRLIEAVTGMKGPGPSTRLPLR